MSEEKKPLRLARSKAELVRTAVACVIVIFQALILLRVYEVL